MNIAIIVAGGSSDRFKNSFSKKNNSPDQDKLLQPILGYPLIYHTIRAFHDHQKIDRLFIVANKSNKKRIMEIVKKYHFPRVKGIVLGGRERRHSVENGLKAIKNAKTGDTILVHNGANPMVTEKEISECVKAVEKYGAAAVGKKLVDTVKEIKNGHILKTHDRDKLAGMQTPQGATYGLFIEAFKKIKKQDLANNKKGKKKNADTQTLDGIKKSPRFTDEAALIENLGHKVKLVPASENNFKITTAPDLEKARHAMGDTPKDFLVGLGQDSHPFSTSLVDKKKSTSLVKNPANGLTLGGAHFKNEPKLQADSDGDVILHALYNAISQALGQGSLGRFATSLCRVHGIKNSREYLRPLLATLSKKGYTLNNVGIMIECARPKIDPLTPQIKKSLSQITGLPPHRIGITATTGENLTSFGRGKGIQCFAIVSIRTSRLTSAQ